MVNSNMFTDIVVVAVIVVVIRRNRRTEVCVAMIITACLAVLQDL